MRPAHSFFLVLAVLGVVVGIPSAGAEDKRTFEGLVEVSEVLIDVLATDEEGKVVLGLDVDDFILEEAGRPVNLSGVSYYTTRYGDEAAAPSETPSSRYLVLFFHDTILTRNFNPRSIRQQFRAGRGTQDWIETQLRGSDWVAVVSYDFGLKVHQDFTQDRDSILFAVEQAISRKDPAKTSPRRRPAPSGTPSILRELPTGKELRKESRNIYKALGTLSSSMGYIIGRKNLLLFTFGFGPTSSLTRMTHGRFYPETEAALNDHNVAVYPIHMGGRGAGQPHNFFLTELAEDTGGVYYENFYEFDKPLEEIGDDNYGYYVLSYQSEHPAGEIGYEKIVVKSPNEEIKIRARRGYRYGL